MQIRKKVLQLKTYIIRSSDKNVTLIIGGKSVSVRQCNRWLDSSNGILFIINRDVMAGLFVKGADRVGAMMMF